MIEPTKGVVVKAYSYITHSEIYTGRALVINNTDYLYFVGKKTSNSKLYFGRAYWSELEGVDEIETEVGSWTKTTTDYIPVTF